MIYGNFKTKKGFSHPETIDGVKFAPYGWKSAHIEGRGRYFDPVSGSFIILIGFLNLLHFLKLIDKQHT